VVIHGSRVEFKGRAPPKNPGVAGGDKTTIHFYCSFVDKFPQNPGAGGPGL
jgi:hypothetical protein